MRRLSLLLVLLISSLCYSQEVSPLRKRESPDVVKKAEDIVKAARESVIAMPFHGYALVPMEVVADPFIVPGGDDCLFMQIIPKGKEHSALFVLKDAPGIYKFVTIPADKEFDRVLVQGLAQGKQTIIWHAIVNGKSSVIDAKAFQVGEKKPDPNPPTPPGPNPPGPDPLPPIPGTGFRVLFVVKNRDLDKLTPAQLNSLTAREVLDYLNAKTVKVDGQPEWRRFQPDTDTKHLSQVWKDAMNRVLGLDPKNPQAKATSFPWVLITNGTKGFEGPLPENTAELMKKLKEFGGQ